jgi:hypothetical protein
VGQRRHEHAFEVFEDLLERLARFGPRVRQRVAHLTGRDRGRTGYFSESTESHRAYLRLNPRTMLRSLAQCGAQPELASVHLFVRAM